jgi:hypothetical protein
VNVGVVAQHVAKHHFPSPESQSQVSESPLETEGHKRRLAVARCGFCVRRDTMWEMPTRANASTHIALLRGVNVGGKNMLPMPKLITLFEDAGCESVKHYIQSGNIIFKAA